MTREKIYVAHSRSYDFQKELYQPILNSKLVDKFEVALPHLTSSEPFNSRDYLKDCKYMLAEVSTPALGLGIEIGWANLYNVEIICLIKRGIQQSGSLKVVSNHFIEYDTAQELVEKIEEFFGIE